MITLAEKFKKRMREEGRTFKWFYNNYLVDVSYPYFIIQLNEKDRLSEEIKKAIVKYLEG